MSESPVILGVRYNNVGASTTCGVCGHTFKAEVGFAPWVDGTQDLACNSCTAVHAPELDALLAKLIDDDYDPDFEPWDGDEDDLARSTLPVVRIRFSSDSLDCQAPAELRHRDCTGFVPNHGQLIPALIEADYQPLCDQCASRVSTTTVDERSRLMSPAPDDEVLAADDSDPWDAPTTGRRHLSLVTGERS